MHKTCTPQGRSRLVGAVLAVLLLCGGFGCAGPRPSGHPVSPAADLVARAARAVEDVRKQDRQGALFFLFRDCRGILVFPSVYKAGFMGAVKGGWGALLARDEAGFYGAPVLVSLGGVSFGMQVGAQRGELILFLLDDEAVRSAAAGQLRAGVDASFALAGLGADVGTEVHQLSDNVYAASDVEGLFAGGAFDFGSLLPLREMNAALYGKNAQIPDILADHEHPLPEAEALRRALWAVGSGP